MSQSNHKNSLPVLPQVQIDTPCHADWGSMAGDEQKRFCGSCQKYVHDLSKMDTESANDLLAERDGNVCVRVRRNPDGSVVTKDHDLSRRGWLSNCGASLAGMMTMLLFGGCRDPFVQGEPEMMGDAVMLGEACPADVPEQPAVEMDVPEQPVVEMGEACPEYTANEPPVMMGKVSSPTDVPKQSSFRMGRAYIPDGDLPIVGGGNAP